MMNLRSATAFAVALLGAGVSAQTFHFSPSGHDVLEGNSNNTIPWWALSATYQQVHDGGDLATSFGGPIAVITSLNFRKDGSLSSAIVGRSIDAQVTLGTTAVPANAVSSNFATNLGAAPQQVLPYTTINLPAASNISLPNPHTWSIPFATPYTYITTAGNLCWELRFMNGTASNSAPCDAANSTSLQSTGLLGTGCIATGQTQAASITTRSLSMTSGAWRNVLSRGAATTPAVFLAGFLATPIPLPGFCTGLEFLPVASIGGVTTATGAWDHTLTFGSIVGMPSVNILAQFAFIDGGLPNGVGLSDASSLVTPPQGNSLFSRIYAAGSGSGNGNETATTGSVGSRTGLVTVFGQ